MEKPSSEKSYCQVCYFDVSISDIVEFDGETHCICKTCFKKYLEVNVNEGKVFTLQCPHCAKKLSYNFLKQMMDSFTLDKFKSFLKSGLTNADPLMRWCPNSKCRIPVILPKKFKRKAECAACKAVLCTECNREYHKGSCNAIFDVEIQRWENHKDIQKCSFCKTIITKNEGCNHMTCSVCGNQWCWLCGGIYYFHSTWNPFGCQFLPFSSQSSSSSQKAVHYFLLSCLIILGFLIGLLLGAPIFLIGHKKDAPKFLKRHPSLFILCVIFSVILQPVFDAVMLFVIIPKSLIGYLLKMKKLKKRQIEILSENRELIGLGITRQEVMDL